MSDINALFEGPAFGNVSKAALDTAKRIAAGIGDSEYDAAPSVFGGVILVGRGKNGFMMLEIERDGESGCVHMDAGSGGAFFSVNLDEEGEERAAAMLRDFVSEKRRNATADTGSRVLRRGALLFVAATFFAFSVFPDRAVASERSVSAAARLFSDIHAESAAERRANTPSHAFSMLYAAFAASAGHEFDGERAGRLWDMCGRPSMSRSSDAAATLRKIVSAHGAEDVEISVLKSERVLFVSERILREWVLDGGVMAYFGDHGGKSRAEAERTVRFLKGVLPAPSSVGGRTIRSSLEREVASNSGRRIQMGALAVSVENGVVRLLFADGSEVSMTIREFENRCVYVVGARRVK